MKVADALEWVNARRDKVPEAVASDLLDLVGVLERAHQVECQRADDRFDKQLAAERERDRLRAALTAIAEYEPDWTKGVAAHVAALQAIAERALEEKG
jgi:hypothetical protein